MEFVFGRLKKKGGFVSQKTQRVNENDHARLLSLSRLQHNFLTVVESSSKGSSHTLELKRLIQFRDEVVPLVESCKEAGYPAGQLLEIARVALDTIVDSPQRRGLNEYFACFQARTEGGFLRPPAMLAALNAADREVLRREAEAKIVEGQQLLENSEDPLDRYIILDEMRRDALTAFCGSDPQVQQLQIRTLAAAIRADEWPAAMEQWRCSVRFIRPETPTWRNDESIRAAVQDILAAKRTILSHIENVGREHGPIVARTLSDSLARFEQRMGPVDPREAPDVPTGKVDEFAILRQSLTELPQESTLRARLAREFQKYYAASGEEKNLSRHIIQNLSQLPPLRSVPAPPIESLTAASARNNLREKLRDAFDKRVIGHTKLKKKLIGEILRMSQEAAGTGFTIILKGPSGIGKNTIAEAIAKALDKEFIHVPCNGMQDSNTVLGDRKVFVGSEPGKAVRILMEHDHRGVIMWDEVGKSGPQCQAAIHQIIDFSQNSKVKDTYFGDVNLDFSGFIHVVAYNEGEAVYDSLGGRGAFFSLGALTEDERGEVLDAQLKIWGPRYFGGDAPMPILAGARKALIDRNSNEAGARRLVEDAKSLLSAAREISDSGTKIVINGQLVLQCLDDAVVTQIPYRKSIHADLVHLFNLSRPRVLRGEGEPEETKWLWRLTADGSEFQIEVDEKSSSIQVCSGKPFYGFLGMALMAEKDDLQGIFTEKVLRSLEAKNDLLVISSTTFFNATDGTETAAYDNLWKSRAPVNIRFALSPVSGFLSNKDAHALINAALRQKEE